MRKLGWLARKRFIIPVFLVILGWVWGTSGAIAGNSTTPSAVNGAAHNNLEMTQKMSPRPAAQFTNTQLQRNGLTHGLLTGSYLTSSHLYAKTAGKLGQSNEEN